MYLVEDGEHAFIVDPCADLTQYDPAVRYDLIILTHEHYDHISGVNVWKEKTKAPVICSRACAANIRDPKKNMSRYFEAFASVQTLLNNKLSAHVEDYTCEADVVFEEQMQMDWQGHALEFIHIPGHSAGSSLLLLDSRYLFSGDSLFKDQPTECRLMGGSAKKWETCSLPIIQNLDGDLMVYPGHFEPFLLRERGASWT